MPAGRPNHVIFNLGPVALPPDTEVSLETLKEARLLHISGKSRRLPLKVWGPSGFVFKGEGRDRCILMRAWLRERSMCTSIKIARRQPCFTGTQFVESLRVHKHQPHCLPLLSDPCGEWLGGAARVSGSSLQRGGN